MPDLHTINRRAHRRVLVSNMTTVSHEGDQYQAKVLNISAGGAGISLDVRLADQSRISVNVENFGIIPARVVRQMRDGIGVKFEMSEEKEQAFIRQVTKIVSKKRLEQATAN
ncbi:PilZ domain-containing protein [Sneathiella marina]|uniref:PilZ domain-containing protein n=1 Tax=Sneathiella marina TaxID=2950108 RepID=A0ABY4W5V1_9PROT|nr:PilZ domain-containing protein [Sneathiella marina]USG60026.1 PilZ domain-containing protein [Sneathiella marina]